MPENEYISQCPYCGKNIKKGDYQDKKNIPINCDDGRPHTETCDALTRDRKAVPAKKQPEQPPLEGFKPIADQPKPEPKIEQKPEVPKEQPKPRKKPKEEPDAPPAQITHPTPAEKKINKEESEFVRADEIEERTKNRSKTPGAKCGETAIVTRIPEEQQSFLVPRFDEFAMQNAISNFQLLSKVLKDNMLRGHHYGKFPGWQKDQLLEPGASLIMNGFKLCPDPVRIDRVEDDDGHYRMHITVFLRPIGANDIVIAAGVGSASTREVKYAYRWVKESQLPSGVDKESLFKKTNDYGTSYRLPNPDVGDLENTILKMAMKRAEVDAVNHLPGVSELFPPANVQ